jgi:hypothetical protein
MGNYQSQTTNQTTNLVVTSNNQNYPPLGVSPNLAPLPDLPNIPRDEHKKNEWFHHIHMHYRGLQIISSDPLMIVVQDFFSDEVCDRLIKIINSGRLRKLTIGNRKCEETRLPHDEIPELMEQFKQLLLQPPSHMEPLKLTRYEVGDFFRPHQDPSKKGERVVTAFVYLNDVPEGGCTRFTHLRPEVKITPKRGMAVIFFPSRLPTAPKFSTGSHRDDRMLHEGMPIDSGHKDICQMWTWAIPIPKDRRQRMLVVMITTFFTLYIQCVFIR